MFAATAYADPLVCASNSLKFAHASHMPTYQSTISFVPDPASQLFTLSLDLDSQNRLSVPSRYSFRLFQRIRPPNIPSEPDTRHSQVAH